MNVKIARPGMLVLAAAVLRTILDRLVAPAPGAADAGALNGCKYHLFKNDVTPTKDSAIADFTQPTFTGYAASAAVVFGSSFEGDDGNAISVGATAQFSCTADPAEPETIYGYYVTDGAGTGYKGAERFDEPVVIGAAGDACVIVPELAFPRP